MTLSISSAFDGGNIEFVGVRGDIVDLTIRREPTRYRTISIESVEECLYGAD